jgi:hypothetical protein
MVVVDVKFEENKVVLLLALDDDSVGDDSTVEIDVCNVDKVLA